MKKIIYIVVALLASILLAPSSFATSEGPVRGDGDVSIISVNEISKTDGVTVNSDPSFSGLSMSFNVTFVEQSDRIEYEATIRNNSDTDYMISEETTFNPNDYLTYTYQVADPTLKAHSESKVRVAVEYTTEVPDVEFTGGVYGDKNRAVIKLLNNDGSTANPNTYDAATSKYIVATIICAVLMLAFLLLFAKKRGRAKFGLFALTIALGVLPLLSFALDTIELTINAEVSIKKAYELAYQLDFAHSDAYVKSTDYDLSQATCNGVVYLGEVSDANKYQRCNYPIIKDRSYAIGETVKAEVKTYSFLLINYTNNCDQIDDGVKLCSRDDVEIQQESAEIWNYSHIREGHYMNQDDDKATMNIEGVWYDDWNSGGQLIFDAPTTFTMPSHNVLFHQHLIM